MPHLTPPWAGAEREKRTLMPPQPYANGSSSNSNPNTPRDERKDDVRNRVDGNAKPAMEEREMVQQSGPVSSSSASPSFRTPARSQPTSTSVSHLGETPRQLNQHPPRAYKAEPSSPTEEAPRVIVTPQTEGNNGKERMRHRSPHSNPYYSSPPHSNSKVSHHHHHHYLHSHRSPPHSSAATDHYPPPYHYGSPSSSYSHQHHHHHRYHSADYTAPRHHARYPPPSHHRPSYESYYNTRPPPPDNSTASSLGGNQSHPNSRPRPSDTSITRISSSLPVQSSPTSSSISPDHTHSEQVTTVKAENKNKEESVDVATNQNLYHKDKEESEETFSNEQKEDDNISSANTETTTDSTKEEEHQEKAEVCTENRDKKRALDQEEKQNKHDERGKNDDNITTPTKAKRSKITPSSPTTTVDVTSDAQIQRERPPHSTHSTHHPSPPPPPPSYAHRYASSSYSNHHHYRASPHRTHYDETNHSYHNHHHNNRFHHRYASSRRTDLVSSPYSHGMEHPKYYHHYSRSRSSITSQSSSRSSPNQALMYSHYNSSHPHYKSYAQVPDAPKSSSSNSSAYNHQLVDKSDIHGVAKNRADMAKSNSNNNIAVHAIPSRERCKELTPPIPSKFWGNIEKFKDVVLPEFHHLVNFPSYVSKNKALNNSNQNQNTKNQHPASPNAVTRRCVMCGLDRLCTASTISNNPSSAPINAKTLAKETSPGNTVHIIPRQNKGLCTACDVTVWVYIPPKNDDEFQSSRNPKLTTNIEIKWCKGCKNFRTWAAFGDKGGATKCVKCRERQREKYATLKKVTTKKAYADNQCNTNSNSTETLHGIPCNSKTENNPSQPEFNLLKNNSHILPIIENTTLESQKNDKDGYGVESQNVDGCTDATFTTASGNTRLDVKQELLIAPSKSTTRDQSKFCKSGSTLTVNRNLSSPTTVKSNIEKEVAASGLDKLIAAVHAQEV